MTIQKKHLSENERGIEEALKKIEGFFRTHLSETGNIHASFMDVGVTAEAKLFAEGDLRVRIKYDKPV